MEHVENVGTLVYEPSQLEARLVPFCNGTIEGLDVVLPTIAALPADYDGWIGSTP